MIGIRDTEFEKIFREWYVPIRNYIYYKSADSQVAEDIAQDTFLKIWGKRDYIIPEKVHHLLFRISGTVEILKNDSLVATIDYGNGDRDSKATVTINGTSEEIDLFTCGFHEGG